MILITGATGAIGKEIARQLAAKRHPLILACRSIAKGRGITDEINREFNVKARLLELDLADSNSVREAADSLDGVELEAIINNAGVMNGSYRLDADGHEDTLNVNYHNTRLLNELLLGNMKDKEGCLVFTTSATRNWFRNQPLTEELEESEFNRMRSYALSKKLITRYARDLSASLLPRGIRVNCADPGIVDTPMLRMGRWFDPLTDLFFRPFCNSPRKGAQAAVSALLSSETGKIFTPTSSKPISGRF